MPEIDALASLAFSEVRTDAVADFPIKVSAGGAYVIDRLTLYNSNGSQGSATLGVYTQPNAGGVALRAPVPLSSLSGPTVVATTNVAATTRVDQPVVYVRVAVASGVAGSTIRFALYGLALP